MEHSKTPWGYCGEKREKPEVCCCMQIWSTPGDHPVARVESGKWGDDYPTVKLEGGSLDRKAVATMEQITYGEIPIEVAEANARFIVKACNCHDELLEACKRTLWRLDEDKDSQLISDLKVVIAKAEEKL